jgi:ketosteroid isomerase-like protein
VTRAASWIASSPTYAADSVTEQNVELVRRYFADCVSGASGPDQPRALALVDELLSPDFVMSYNNDGDAEAVRGREQHKDFLVRHGAAFPGDTWTLEAILAAGPTVACRWHFEATHAETGNAVQARAADFFRVEDGRIAELRRFLDFESFYRQVQAAGPAD